MSDCCNPCPTTQTANVPGPEGEPGAPGTDGADGVNAFTQTTADFEVPLAGQNVTINVLDSTWMTVGQKIIFEGPATFEVVSKPTTTAVVGKFMAYVDDVDSGETVASGSNCSPCGVQGPDETLLPAISSYAVGGAQALTASPAQALSVSVTLTQAKTYLLIFAGRFDFDVATIADTEDVTLKMRRTNNTAADISNAVAVGKTGAQSAASKTMAFPQCPAVTYTATAGDVIQLYASMSDTPYSGAVNVVEGSILAIPLF